MTEAHNGASVAAVENGRTLTADDPRVVQAMEEYVNAVEAGKRVDRQEFLGRHAEVADVLAGCLDGLEFIQSARRELSESDQEPAADDLRTKPLGDFRILREIGRGGMGIVYEAEQLSLDRRVALKVLPFASALDGRQIQRFKNEAQAAACLHHTNIVPVHAVGSERGVHYYAMQFIDGQPLSAIIGALRQAKGLPRTEPMNAPADENRPTASFEPEARLYARGDIDTEPELQAALPTKLSVTGQAFFRAVAELGEQAALGLDYAHQRGIVHRDVKPGNLLLDGDGTVWITDFGLAHVQSDTRLTMTGDLLGTLRYMSPEQALAKRVIVDHRTDIYSLGATLYELLTLEPALTGKHREEIFRQIAFEDPQPLRRINKAIPPELETIVLKALEKNPLDRYVTAKEMASDLRRFVDDKPIQARRPTIGQRVTRWGRRHRAIVGGVGVAMFLTIVGLGIATALIWNEQGRTQRALGAEKAAREEAQARESETKAVLDFVRYRIFAAARPQGKDGGLHRDVKLRDAIDASLPFVENSFREQPLIEASLRFTLGVSYIDLGDAKLAQTQFAKARRLYEGNLGPDHRATLRCRNWQAISLREQGKYSESLKLSSELFQLMKAKLGPDDLDTLSAMNNLACCYFHLDRHQMAIELDEENLRISKGKLGADDPETLAIMHNLALTYRAVGRVAEALGLEEVVVASRRIKLGANHPDTLSGLQCLANYYGDVGRYADALKLRQDLVQIHMTRYGPDDPDTVKAVANLAWSYGDVGRYEEAIKIFEDTIRIGNAKYGPDNPLTLRAQANLVWSLLTATDPKLRDPARALRLAKEVNAIAPDRDSWNNLGMAHYRVGEWENSIQSLQKSMELQNGGDPWDWFVLAMAHWKLGKKKEASQWYEKAVKWMDKKMPNHRDLRRFRAEASELLGVKDIRNAPGAPKDAKAVKQ
jgi:eukaryotic-like serine/threonine-protein kinase